MDGSRFDWLARSVAALLLAALPLGLWPSAAWAVPTCFGKPATHVMQPGDPQYFGTYGDDVVVGSAEPDSIVPSNFGGTDFVCGGGGDDFITVLGPGSKADGGAGRDRVKAIYGGLARGGSGDDLAVEAAPAGGWAEGGSGNDVVFAMDGAIADGGSGNDFVQGRRAAALLGGSGSDTIDNLGGTPKIDCGSAYDLVSANGATDVRRCEGTYNPNP